MSEEADKESKTEEATEKKLHDSTEKGRVPHSREVAVFATVAGALLYGAFFAAADFGAFGSKLSRLFDLSGGITLETSRDATILLAALGRELALFLLPPVVIFMFGGVAASVFQNAPRLVADRIEPKLSRISPMAGWSRLFGTSGLVEFAKSVVKVTAVATIAGLLLKIDRTRILNTMFSDPSTLPELILSLAIRLLTIICASTVVLMVGDLAWSRINWRRELRMTRQEVKDEHKQMEGDPMVKSRLRSLARDRARRRMMDAVPRATLVLANPTHYAIALRYVREEGGAPVVLAKGQDLLALRIREIAEANDIPVIENKPLVRSMYDLVEVDRMIPPDFYHAIAELFCFLYYKK
jgi:flagellar biosynthetic protein FlhB